MHAHTTPTIALIRDDAEDVVALPSPDPRRAQRAFVQLYDNGTLCDLTGKPRQTLVRSLPCLAWRTHARAMSGMRAPCLLGADFAAS